MATVTKTILSCRRLIFPVFRHIGFASNSMQPKQMTYKRYLSRLPRSKRISENDHSYTKTTRQSQRGKSKPSYEIENDSSSSDESESLIDKSAPCHGCKKQIAISGNGVCCNFCEHWYCLGCSKLKKSSVSGPERIS